MSSCSNATAKACTNEQACRSWALYHHWAATHRGSYACRDRALLANLDLTRLTVSWLAWQLQAIMPVGKAFCTFKFRPYACTYIPFEIGLYVFYMWANDGKPCLNTRLALKIEDLIVLLQHLLILCVFNSFPSAHDCCQQFRAFNNPFTIPKASLIKLHQVQSQIVFLELDMRGLTLSTHVSALAWASFLGSYSISNAHNFCHKLLHWLPFKRPCINMQILLPNELTNAQMEIESLAVACGLQLCWVTMHFRDQSAWSLWDPEAHQVLSPLERVLQNCVCFIDLWRSFLRDLFLPLHMLISLSLCRYLSQKLKRQARLVSCLTVDFLENLSGWSCRCRRLYCRSSSL